jgi:hypothetical protein
VVVNTKHLIILVLVVSAAFLIHISPVFFLPQNQYNFYDTDSWHFIQEVRDVRDGSAGEVFPRFVALFAGASETPLDIFNTVGYLPPVLSLLFTFIIYFMISRLFNEQTGFYAAVMMAIGVGIFFQNATFGFIDHHQLQVILFITCVLSVLLVTKNKWWCVPAAFSGAALYFVSPVTWIMYYAIIAGVVWIVVLGVIRSETQKLLLSYFVATAIGAGVVLNYVVTEGLLNLWNWTEPINELSSPDVFFLLSHYNVLIIPVVIGLMLFVFSKFNSAETALVAASVVAFALTLRFIRMELILFPLIVILAAFYLDKIFKMETSVFSKKAGWCIICIFIVVSADLGCMTSSYFVGASQYNERFNGAIHFLEDQPRGGMVLSFWNYGHWLRLSGQSIYSDPNQWNATEMARVLSDKTFPAEPISYILVTNDDWKLYPAIQYYSGSKTLYEDSYLRSLVNGDEPGLVYNEGGIRIYRYQTDAFITNEL